MTEHLHRDLLSTIDEMLQDRELRRGFQTHIGKVKSHTGIWGLGFRVTLNPKTLNPKPLKHSRSLSTNRQMNYALEIAWGVHNTRLRAGNKKPRGPLLCRVCKKYLSNSHLAGDCHVHQNMRTRRHNSAFTLLKKLVESSEGGRWPTITSDLGQRPVHDFHDERPRELAMHTDPPPPPCTICT